MFHCSEQHLFSKVIVCTGEYIAKNPNFLPQPKKKPKKTKPLVNFWPPTQKKQNKKKTKPLVNMALYSPVIVCHAIYHMSHAKCLF